MKKPRAWLLLVFQWLVFSTSPKPTSQTPILADDVWDLQRKSDPSDEGRSVKTSRPLVIFCRDDGLIMRRPPGDVYQKNGYYILVKPGSKPRLEDPCIVTEAPIFGSSGGGLGEVTTVKPAQPTGNVAVWPSIDIVVATTSSSPVDSETFKEVAGQLLEDSSDIGQSPGQKPSTQDPILESSASHVLETSNHLDHWHRPSVQSFNTPASGIWPHLLPSTESPREKNTLQQLLPQNNPQEEKPIHAHANLIYNTPSVPAEIEVECGCDADIPLKPVQEPRDPAKTPSPVTSNVVKIPDGPTGTTTLPEATTTEEPRGVLMVNDFPNSQPNGIGNSIENIADDDPEDTVWVPETTPQQVRVVTKIVTSISGGNIDTKRPISFEENTVKTVEPISKPLKPADSSNDGVKFSELVKVNDQIDQSASTDTNDFVSSFPGPASSLQRTMWWIYLISKQALFILLGLIVLFATQMKSHSSSSSSSAITHHQPAAAYNLPPVYGDLDADYYNVYRIYQDVLNSLNGNSYTIPTDIVISSLGKDVYYDNQVSGNYAAPPTPTDNDPVNLDYILNVINNYRNDHNNGYQYYNGNQKPKATGYG